MCGTPSSRVGDVFLTIVTAVRYQGLCLQYLVLKLLCMGWGCASRLWR